MFRTLNSPTRVIVAMLYLLIPILLFVDFGMSSTVQQSLTGINLALISLLRMYSIDIHTTWIKPVVCTTLFASIVWSALVATTRVPDIDLVSMFVHVVVIGSVAIVVVKDVVALKNRV